MGDRIDRRGGRAPRAVPPRRPISCRCTRYFLDRRCSPRSPRGTRRHWSRPALGVERGPATSPGEGQVLLILLHGDPLRLMCHDSRMRASRRVRQREPVQLRRLPSTKNPGRPPASFIAPTGREPSRRGPPHGEEPQGTGSGPLHLPARHDSGAARQARSQEQRRAALGGVHSKRQGIKVDNRHRG
jgi:hypothetical protein